VCTAPIHGKTSGEKKEEREQPNENEKGIKGLKVLP
jgi:hypothetical protein